MRRLVRFLRLLAVTLKGYGTFLRTGHTPNEAYLGMRQLFCRTDGWFNDVLAYFIGISSPLVSVPAAPSALGSLSTADIERTVTRLRQTGISVLSVSLPSALCDRLIEFARSTPCAPLRSSEVFQYGGPVCFDETRPVSNRYDFDLQTLMACPAVQEVATDPLLLAVAQRYLKSRPILDQASMWWSAAHSPAANSAAAQMFHFDLDRLKFLKFFFYLTDVGPETGPFCFVSGSHQRKPLALRRDGRFTDEEISNCYSPAEMLEVAGKKGTIIVADTRGFHKGKVLGRGFRLMFQVEFAVSLFGAPYETLNPATLGPEYRSKMARHPVTYSSIVK